MGNRVVSKIALWMITGEEGDLSLGGGSVVAISAPEAVWSRRVWAGVMLSRVG
jgi:hypothetical protein